MPPDSTTRGANGHADQVAELAPPRWGEPPDGSPRRRPHATGEVMPRQRGRLSRGIHLMAGATARRFGVDPEKSRFWWVPVVSLVVSVVLALSAALLAYGVWRGRQEVKAEALSDNQKATAALINASEARLIKAADEIRSSTREMRSELNTKVEAIDGKVESIRASVSDWKAEQSAELAGLRARLDAANEDKGRLWEQIETYNLKLERLERQQRGAPTPPNGGH